LLLLFRFLCLLNETPSEIATATSTERNTRIEDKNSGSIRSCLLRTQAADSHALGLSSN
jgi:hypothetical protein